MLAVETEEAFSKGRAELYRKKQLSLEECSDGRMGLIAVCLALSLTVLFGMHNTVHYIFFFLASARNKTISHKDLDFPFLKKQK